MWDDIENCCRICLDTLDVESDRLSILNDPTINLHVKSCLAITISPNDHLPKDICSTCVTQLSEFYHFQQNAHCCQEWLETAVRERRKKTTESKMTVQPLPASEYNSDSLLEFLNNTANIEEYLNNLGKEGMPSIVNMLDKSNDNPVDSAKLSNNTKTKISTLKKKDTVQSRNHDMNNMEIDILDSDFEIVNEILTKQIETRPKQNQTKTDRNFICFACKIKCDNLHKLSEHLSFCDNAARTCVHCNTLFDSKQKMLQHRVTHHASSMTCNCGKQFHDKETLLQHYKQCQNDHISAAEYSYRCKQCGQTFKERYLLYKHAKGHIIKSEERMCDICGHNFTGNEALSKHMREEHKKPDNLMYRCKICSMTCSNHKQMYLHVQNHMMKKVPSRHLCESCGRSFASRATLKRHSIQHKSVKIYKCNICERKFLDENTRDKHIFEHTEVVMCDRCGQNVNKYKLDTHFCK